MVQSLYLWILWQCLRPAWTGALPDTYFFSDYNNGLLLHEMRGNEMDERNTSSSGKLTALPDGEAGWSWGAFVFSWIWAIGNRTWPGLIAIIPGVGLIARVVLGMRGRQWAWRMGRWDSVEHFRRVQRRWNIAAGVVAALLIVAIVALIALPGNQHASGKQTHGHVGEQLEL